MILVEEERGLKGSFGEDENGEEEEGDEYDNDEGVTALLGG